MKTYCWRRLLAAVLLGCVVQSGAQQAAPGAPQAQPATPADAAAAVVRQSQVQPLNNAPFWREVRSGEHGFTQVGAPPEQGVLIQSRGETWRELRGPMLLIGGLMVAMAVAGLGGFYAIRGTMKVGRSGSGMLVQRFAPADRWAHWFLAIVWVSLAISGLILSIGKFVLMPVIGGTLFGVLALVAKYVHNYMGPLLLIAVPWMIVRFLRHNRISGEDFKWFMHIFDYFKGHEYPSGKFNAGEKMVFWVVLVVLSTVLIVTGLVLNFPNYGQSRATMQTMNVVHAVAAYLAMALAAVHMYLGTIGMTGAYRAMRDGYVTAEWAEHHHARWYEDVKAGRARPDRLVPETDVPPPIRTAVLAAEK